MYTQYLIQGTSRHYYIKTFCVYVCVPEGSAKQIHINEIHTTQSKILRNIVNKFKIELYMT